MKALDHVRCKFPKSMLYKIGTLFLASTVFFSTNAAADTYIYPDQGCNSCQRVVYRPCCTYKVKHKVKRVAHKKTYSCYKKRIKRYHYRPRSWYKIEVFYPQAVGCCNVGCNTGCARRVQYRPPCTRCVTRTMPYYDYDRRTADDVYTDF